MSERWVGVGPKGGGPKGEAQRERGPKGGRAQNFALFFFPLPLPFSLFFSLSLWRSSRGILVVFLKAGKPWPTQIARFDSSGVIWCELRRPHRRPQIHEKTLRERKKERKWEPERETKSDILGGPAEGGPPQRGAGGSSGGCQAEEGSSGGGPSGRWSGGGEQMKKIGSIRHV